MMATAPTSPVHLGGHDWPTDWAEDGSKLKRLRARRRGSDRARRRWHFSGYSVEGAKQRARETPGSSPRPNARAGGTWDGVEVAAGDDG
jgi:hypothetical protein